MRHLHSFSFFKFIDYTFGSIPVRLLKDWTKYRRNIYKCKLRIRFIKFCIQNGVVPPHLFGVLNFNLHLRNHHSLMKFGGIKNSLIKRLLRIELNDAYRNINFYRNGLFHLARNITKHLPFNIARNFFDSRERSLHFFFNRERLRIDERCDWLVHKQTSAVNSKILPLKYYCLSPSVMTSHTPSSPNNKKFSLSIPSSHHGTALEISIKPSSFINTLTSPPPLPCSPSKRTGLPISPRFPSLLTFKVYYNWAITFPYLPLIKEELPWNL